MPLTEPRSHRCHSEKENKERTLILSCMTEWTVLTGAPSSGKTTLITQLEMLGKKCLPEAAGMHVESCLRTGKSLETICADQQQLQRGILHQAMRLESSIDDQTPHILDRSAVDSLAYCRLYTIDPGYIQKHLILHAKKYKKVLQLDRLPFEKNNVRIENDTLSAALDRHLHDVYSELGYDVIRIPVLSVRERVQAILHHL